MTDPDFLVGRALTLYILTARKRRLGQGNVFTPVCHSVHRGVWSRGDACWGGLWSQVGGCLLPGGCLLRGGGWVPGPEGA